MTTLVVQVVDTFTGQKPYQPTFKESELVKCDPFTNEEVDAMLPSFPQVMVEDMELTLQAFRLEQANPPGDAITELRKRFYDCIAWIYELFESESRISFDQACLCLAMDPEIIRASVSFGFANEIREFVTMYGYAYPKEVNRLKKALHGYIDFYN